MRKVYAKAIVKTRLRLCDLADVLASGRADQAVRGVVSVIVIRRYDLVVEKDRLLRIVMDVSNVAARIVGEEKILQSLRAAQCLQMSEPEG